MRLVLLLLLLFPLLGQAEVEDIKCYVALEGGYYVVLQHPLSDVSKKNIDRTFKTKGYEIDGIIRHVTEVLECTSLAAQFSSTAAQQQDAIQPR
ncbi:TapY2 family type IVa secretion system protein [Aeromonas cavernicola]|uniref:Uncharacterized protein n=1 Tax=Aeromonas cavernicola TaxID=1006623 RepID=A0A2H9U605_9GAMM|nr:TapY2 family type IVa secretion system protein [Aeromonas cavernicola]PJG59408.1 hypothetical protein CUC53_07445 [Aeromonas cavernicola]